MTIRTKRRGRRSLAAILAAMLMASVLAVVAGSPAQAANTSSEALVDHDNDAATPKVREFGGRDRYDTASRLADNFGKAEGFGAVPVAFVASGYKLVDAISVAGLAGFLDAPVLLTNMDSLDHRVADFIEDYGVSTVYVLGGASAVADSVVEAIEALANEPTVSRIAEADRYGTAAAVASRLGGGAAWCGGSEAAAILANGGDVSLAYAMAISPVANRLQLPLLLTAQDELSSATEDFITGQDIEHVVIMGGESSVSDDVSAALTDAGVGTVTRIPGDTPAEASAALADLVTNGCQVDLGLVEDDTVALVAENGLPDGVAASPILASSYRNGSLVPMLVVGDELPAAVSDYLAMTPELKSDGNKLHMEIVAIGGTGAVSDEVMQAALMAAASAMPLTASITSADLVEGSTTEYKPPQVGHASVVLRFNDNIVDDDPDASPATTALTDLIRDNLEINGAPARLGATDPISREDGTGGTCSPDTVTVNFASGVTLKAGDVVSLAGGAKFGSNMDQRTVAATSVTVPATPRDTSAPVVNVIAIDAGVESNDVAIVRFDPMGLDATNNNNTIDSDEIVITSASATTKVAAATQNLATSQTITANTANDDGGPSGTAVAFAAGDRITIKSGALVDEAGNKSRARTFTVLEAEASPRITAVNMSSAVHTAQASIGVPNVITEENLDSDPDNDIKISARKGGAADGAVGNGWTIAFDRATAWKADPKAEVDIDVRVNATDRLISVRFDAGNAKFADLKAELEANSSFDAMFEVTLPPDASGACGATANNPLQISAVTRGQVVMTAGGMTAVAIEVRFDAYALSIDADTNLADDVFAQVVNRYNANPANTDLASPFATAVAGVTTATRIAANLVNNDDGTPGSDGALGDLTGPTKSARYEMVTDRADLLPKMRDLVDTAAGTADADQVAAGYAADDADTANADESRNDASQVRIGTSSSVKAPNFMAP